MLGEKGKLGNARAVQELGFGEQCDIEMQSKPIDLLQKGIGG